MLTTVTIAALGIGGVALAMWRLLARMQDEVGIRRVRLSALGGHMGARVRFRHPTDRSRMVEGHVLAVRESPLCVAWVRVTVEAADGARTDYEVTGQGWAVVAT